jgi:hypothetical protein
VWKEPVLFYYVLVLRSSIADILDRDPAPWRLECLGLEVSILAVFVFESLMIRMMSGSATAIDEQVGMIVVSHAHVQWTSGGMP